MFAADNCSSVINRNTREAQGGQNISLDLSVEMVRYLIRSEMFLPFSSEKMSEVWTVDGGGGGWGGAAICARRRQTTSKLGVTFAKILICMQNSTLEEETLKANQSQVKASERGAEQHLKRRPRHKQALGADLFISPVDEEVRASSHTSKSCSKQRRQAVNNRLFINSGLRPKSFGAISTAEDRFLRPGVGKSSP